MDIPIWNETVLIDAITNLIGVMGKLLCQQMIFSYLLNMLKYLHLAAILSYRLYIISYEITDQNLDLTDQNFDLTMSQEV